jgi:hypothetical protein
MGSAEKPFFSSSGLPIINANGVAVAINFAWSPAEQRQYIQQRCRYLIVSELPPAAAMAASIWTLFSSLLYSARPSSRMAAQAKVECNTGLPQRTEIEIRTLCLLSCESFHALHSSHGEKRGSVLAKFYGATLPKMRCERNAGNRISWSYCLLKV